MKVCKPEDMAQRAGRLDLLPGIDAQEGAAERLGRIGAHDQRDREACRPRTGGTSTNLIVWDRTSARSPSA